MQNVQHLMTQIYQRIDLDRLNKFVRIAIEANQTHNEILGPTMKLEENVESAMVLNQGIFLLTILTNIHINPKQ
jgi:hypothetical protein